MTVRPYPEYQNTPLWRAVAGMVRDLEASGEIRVATAHEYVVGYLCRELAAKRVVTPTSLAAPSAPGDAGAA